MELKRAKVVMLPTNKATYPGLALDGYNYKGKIEPPVLRYVCNNTYRDNINRKGNNIYDKPQHLYITTDDEIKEGDWYISESDNEVSQLISGTTLPESKKIIATTDKLLNHCVSCGNVGCHLCIGKDLPSPSQAFIEKYCELDGIDEIDVEIIKENIHVCDGVFCDIAYDSHHKEFCTTTQYVNKIKTNSNNEIAIHSIKDSWTREEMMDAWESGKDAGVRIGLGRDFYQSKEEWIKKNL